MERVSAARLRLFRAVTVVLAPLVVLGTLEAVLRLMGVGHSTGFIERCEVRGRAAACPNPDFPLRFFPPALARQPTPFVIPEEKGPRTARVVVLGESAAPTPLPAIKTRPRHLPLKGPRQTRPASGRATCISANATSTAPPALES